MNKFYVVASFRFILIAMGLFLAINGGYEGILICAGILTMMTPPVREP